MHIEYDTSFSSRFPSSIERCRLSSFHTTGEWYSVIFDLPTGSIPLLSVSAFDRHVLTDRQQTVKSPVEGILDHLQLILHQKRSCGRT